VQVELHQLHRKYAALRICDRATRAALMASLSSEGQLMPVVVVRADHAERYVLIDGYQRVGALEGLGRDVVDAVVISMPEGLALAMSHRLQKGREPSALEEGWLLEELIVGHGHTQTSLPTLLGRDKSWVSRRLAMVKTLPESVQEEIRAGRVGPRAAMRALVPLARANAEHCVRLVENLPRPAPPARAMERLYDAWRRGDPEVKARIVDKPGLWLRANSETDAVVDADPALLADLAMLASIAVRAGRRVDLGATATMSARERRRFERATREARHAFGGLMARLAELDGDVDTAPTKPTEETSDARPRSARRDLAPVA
jgi:ParB/RepB/Spo0J family partition protein